VVYGASCSEAVPADEHYLGAVTQVLRDPLDDQEVVHNGTSHRSRSRFTSAGSSS
jgi:hypothetical protein